MSGTLSACGTVTGKDITGDLRLTCDTTITKSRIAGRVISQGHRLVATDVDLGPTACPSGPGDYALISSSDFALTRVHVQHSSADLIQVGGGGKVTVVDSLLDGACFYPGDHLDAVQFYDPGAKADITIRHSSLDVRASNTSDKGNAAVFVADNPGHGSVFTIDGNRLAGGNYTTAFYDAPRGAGVTILATGNTYVRGSSQYGPCATNSAPYDGTDGLAFTANTQDDGTPLPSC